MNGQHHYTLTVKWTGNNGSGTSGYRAYERDHTIMADNKQEIRCSADPVFRGDKTKYNPEDLLVASLSTCHMLSYLHACAVAGVVVTDYVDRATGVMSETSNGGGHFTEVNLHPDVTVADISMVDKANELHEKAGEMCFIASSVNFPVKHHPVCRVAEVKL
ncbi:MAG TPA: OsmC family protein [Puia sp.]|nr:OsmC family protein [Puia sp.]